MKKQYKEIMKRFIVSFVIAFMVVFGTVSCVDSNVPHVESTVNNVNVSHIGDIHMVKYDYEGHTYQMHYHGAGNATVAGVVHDPDCKCFKNTND